jgi:hypothetical protein
VRSILTFDTGLAVISGGEYVLPGDTQGFWTINDAQVVVRGSGLVLDGGRLTGFLDDGNPIDVRVGGNIQNMTLIPEPSTAVLVSLGLVAAAARRRVQLRAGRPGI